MSERLEKFIGLAKSKFGLKNYRLHTHDISRHVNEFKETEYVLAMEFFPPHVEGPLADGSNPPGTAVIEMDVQRKMFNQVIFVEGKSFAEDGVAFPNLDTNRMIQWIEKETGLTYDHDFFLVKSEERKLYFEARCNGLPVYPLASIEIELDENGRLILFSIDGSFPKGKRVKTEKFHLSLETLADIAKQQIQLVEFPLHSNNKILPFYSLEEIFISNDDQHLMEIAINPVIQPVPINQTISWQEPLQEDFERQEIAVEQKVTFEQALAGEPSPDVLPITEEEQQNCVKAVWQFLRQVYPDDSGKWILKTLHRESGWIHASLRREESSSFIMQRKLTVVIDPNHFQAINYFDNQEIIETVYSQFEKQGEINIEKEEAFEKLKERMTLKPVYVYDQEKDMYRLCGKLECDYAINAINGEMVHLNDI